MGEQAAERAPSIRSSELNPSTPSSDPDRYVHPAAVLLGSSHADLLHGGDGSLPACVTPTVQTDKNGLSGKGGSTCSIVVVVVAVVAVVAVEVEAEVGSR